MREREACDAVVVDLIHQLLKRCGDVGGGDGSDGGDAFHEETLVACVTPVGLAEELSKFSVVAFCAFERLAEVGLYIVIAFERHLRKSESPHFEEERERR
jgi:hypothetical protein